MEVLDKIEIALSHCVMAIELILSDAVQYTKPQPEDIKANHEYVEELKKESDESISRIVAEIRNASTQEDAVAYITEILTHCTLYSRLHNDADLKHLKQLRSDYQNAPWYSLAMFEYQLREYEGIFEAGEAIRGNKVPDIDIRQDIAHIFEFYWKLGCRIDAAALLKGVDFIKVQDKCGMWICKEHDQIELIGRLGSAKRVRDLLVKATGTVAEPQPEQTAFAMPPELDTPQAREYLNRAQEAGFITKTSTGYKWTPDNKSECSYFCDLCSEALHLSKAKDRTNWKPFAALFGYRAEALREAKNGWRNKTGLPSRSEEIKAIFK